MIKIISRYAVAVGVLLLALTACGPSNQQAEATAVEYLQAMDRGDKKKECDLSVDGQGVDRPTCLDNAAEGANAYTRAPDVTRVVNWGDDGGVAVVVRVYLQANSEPQWNAIGLVPGGDGWLVSAYGWIEGDPEDDASVIGALS